MQLNRSIRNVSQIYLILVPFIAAGLAFAIGHVSYKLYVPVWIINACLMLLASWFLGANNIRSQVTENKSFVRVASFIIIPWIFFTIFSGMGPPPDTAAGWVATATEQQIRYAILVVGGVLITVGFALLRDLVQKADEHFFSLLGFTAILVAIPLYIINMTFWGSYLVEAFKIFVVSASEKRPDWYVPVRALFAWISAIEVALIYLATAAFAASLKAVGVFSPTACRIYIIVSLLACFVSILPTSAFEPLTIASYLVSIPAFPFIMPYLMAVHLLRRAGNGLPN